MLFAYNRQQYSRAFIINERSMIESNFNYPNKLIHYDLFNGKMK
jgi:hypothetical protein